MALQELYRKSPAAVQSFDYFDFASTTAYKIFNGAFAYDGLAFLTTANILSSFISETAPQPYPTLATSIDKDMDFEFQASMIVDGDAHLQITAIEGNTGAVGTMTSTVTCTIYHVDKSNNETSLGSEVATTTGGNIGTNSYRYYVHELLIPLTKRAFAVGEKIRLNVTITSAGTAGTKVVSFLADPLGETVTIGGSYSTTYTELKLDLPFKTDQ